MYSCSITKRFLGIIIAFFSILTHTRAMNSRIPIILITGFLGAGKTTFINWLLEKHPQLKISVVLNEFGNIKLETQFVKQHTEDIIELNNGCMCCVAKSDVPRTISYILEHSPQTEYILIEASGLSDPDPVREALQTPPVSTATYLESTICIVDTVNFEEMRTQHALITSQIADADLVILSKVEEAGTEKVKNVHAVLENLTPDIRLLEFNQYLAPEIFLTKSQPSATQSTSKHDHHIHEDYQIYWYESDNPLQFEKVRIFISQLPKNIIRIKGAIHAQLPDGKMETITIQRVGSHVMSEPSTQSAIDKSTMLFIGNNFNEETIKQELDNYRVEKVKS